MGYLRRNESQTCPCLNDMSFVMRKLAFCICENKDADQLRGNREADLRLCLFAIRIVLSLSYLNLKFQASSHLQWLYSPVCVGPGWKPRRPVFSERGSYKDYIKSSICQRFSIFAVDHISVSLFHRYFSEQFWIFQFSSSQEYMSRVMNKPVFGIPDQVQHKPGCTTTDDG